MVVQKALSSKTTNGLCDNKFVKMAQMAGTVPSYHSARLERARLQRSQPEAYR